MAKVQLQLSFLEQPSKGDIAPVWPTLTHEQRAEVVATLARLIAKLATTDRAGLTAAAKEKENDDE